MIRYLMLSQEPITAIHLIRVPRYACVFRLYTKRYYNAWYKIILTYRQSYSPPRTPPTIQKMLPAYFTGCWDNFWKPRQRHAFIALSLLHPQTSERSEPRVLCAQQLYLLIQPPCRGPTFSFCSRARFPIPHAHFLFTSARPSAETCGVL